MSKRISCPLNDTGPRSCTERLANGLADAGFPKAEAFKSIVFATAVYLENGTLTLEGQLKFMEANSRERLVELNKALEAIWKTVHDETA